LPPERHLRLVPPPPPSNVPVREPEWDWSTLDWWAVAGILLCWVLPMVGLLLGRFA